jgi:hypothetical protein
MGWKSEVEEVDRKVAGDRKKKAREGNHLLPNPKSQIRNTK